MFQKNVGRKHTLGNTYQTLSNSSSNLNTLTIFLSISRLSNLTLSIFDRVLELNLFCNRHTIIGNSTWHVLALEDNIMSFWSRLPDNE